MEDRGVVLDKDKMSQGLEALDKALGEDEMIYAFSPITMVSAGGYLAVSYFQNRSTTEDIDVIIDPEHASDKELLCKMRTAMVTVGRDLGFGKKWINDSVALFVSKSARNSIFEDAEKQNIVLWSGENLRILAAPLEWGLETKLRRLSTKPHHLKSVTDTDDVLVILNSLIDRNKGLLERDAVRRLNRNGFDVAISYHVLDQIAEAYQQRYGNSPFC
ncbi:hypothetical protein RJZ56_001386 [Blastomyces dermatitidis]|uniref:Nucleotidyltransferase n=3 Tax=Blastomyces TaxID=229219 RepID=A0A179US15_BLAGS|nr:uncharacterized protein BDBG_05557 [Blastomyces gilchristii SLH14081]XP_045274871.1 uncharacterized protein BDCG_02696 [Blastomyces dermatitidis ER-3]EGE77833.1 hypothetical protein BDDG_00770 [Blastomyces dermatitidis ATCC 18188]EQL38123.1 hypothetical protein BDFG_00505 [Blastomyces dermatitidis ATCC 26199]EEQ87576.1 hypothetical protein BDCG_02696 [Blastomyces dermatitidis ER-3]EQL38124.1 hypothetical protein, variant [Blastomyces dermatitidis ATCC 26199]KMW66600.1 hypothetical protein,